MDYIYRKIEIESGKRSKRKNRRRESAREREKRCMYVLKREGE